MFGATLSANENNISDTHTESICMMFNANDL